MQIEFDTPFNGDQIYTRANAGEVFPHLLSPMTWTLMGPSIERGFMRCMAHDFAAVEAKPGAYVACGRMAGRLHLNLSVFRTVAERAPGSSAHDLDIQYFGNAVASGLPGHPQEKVTLGTTLRCTTAALRTMATFGRRVNKEATAARASARTSAEVLAPDAPIDRIVEDVDRVLALHADAFGTHVTARALTSSAVSLATKALTKKGLTEDQALRLISDIPDLESARPSRELQRIAAQVPADGPLRKAVVGGISYSELQSSELEGAADLKGQLATFLEEFGHRGVNEFDPAWRVWGTDPDAVLALLRPVLSTGVPLRRAAVHDDRFRGVTKVFVKQARQAISRAETTKDTIIRVTHDLRLHLDAIAARLEGQVAREDLHLMAWDEILELTRGGSVPDATIERRREEIENALAVTPAEWSVHHLSVTALHEGGSLSELTGIAGSSGVARGPVRILRDVDDEFDDGDVLVASMTDTAWTPLFLAASAVVTDSGGSLSHATIVARELGIPAVVNTKTATSELRDGDLVEVDGDQGTVRIIERSGA